MAMRCYCCVENMEKAGENVPVWYKRIWLLYADGFRNMTVGKYLWAIILVKLAVLFLVFRLFFFPDILNTQYDNDADRAEAVRENLTGNRSDR